ncbi:phosphatase PAP2 family protein [Streptomyces sp. CAU 1734]|uniref:phosphatase PAP2 family protein n=1 Tax=Streptomyces sp. CAU 1734 TaxID=3140360 RepID=UPI003260363B
MGYARCAAAERRLLAALHECGGRPGVAAVARGLSLAGEHGALWLGAGLTGAAADAGRRRAWLRATALVGGAHLASLGVKWSVRRARPGAVLTAPPLVRTAGPYSFPSSHATTSAAALIAFGALFPAGERLMAPLAAAICVSRLVAGVHYPTDIVAGALLGGATARLGSRWTSAPPRTVSAGRRTGSGR